MSAFKGLEQNFDFRFRKKPLAAKNCKIKHNKDIK